MSARLLTCGVLATLVAGVLAACAPDAVPSTPEADAAAPARTLDADLGSPKEPAPLEPGRYVIPSHRCRRRRTVGGDRRAGRLGA